MSGRCCVCDPRPVRRAPAVLAASLVTAAAALAALTPSAGAAPVAEAAPAAVVVPAAGPTPSSWEGGVAVPYAPRWWPHGRSNPSAPWASGWPKPVLFKPTARGELSGMRIALDPGHDLGNSSHLSAINQWYWVGLRKTCNTTGTATNAGYPESTYAFDVVARVRRLLNAKGASVVVTRDRNTRGTYGPCVGARGSFPSQQKADLMVSVHGDGAPSSGRGFHVITPGVLTGYTDDIAAPSRTLALRMIDGMRFVGLRSTTYLSSPLSVRKDVGTLNMSDVPTVMVETLNMRNAADARLASTAAGRQKIAMGLYSGIVRYLRATR